MPNLRSNIKEKNTFSGNSLTADVGELVKKVASAKDVTSVILQQTERGPEKKTKVKIEKNKVDLVASFKKNPLWGLLILSFLVVLFWLGNFLAIEFGYKLPLVDTLSGIWRLK